MPIWPDHAAYMFDTESTEEPELKTCRRCGASMKPGQALQQTYTGGTPDFAGDTGSVTFSPGGPGRLIDCLKCEACGHSVSGSDPAVAQPKEQRT